MLLRNLFHRVQQQPNLYNYHQGPVYTNGALQLVFEKKWAYPVVLVKGAGQYAGQFHTMQSPQLRTQMALTPTTLEAAGVRAGQIDHQYLMDDSPNPDAAMGAI